MGWIFLPDRPIYTQVLDRIKLRIITGVYRSGEKLPSVRELAEEANVNPNTMQKAFSQLEQSGLILTYRTSGRIVTEDQELIKQVKKELAESIICDFLDKLKDLGYTKDEGITIINQMEDK